VEVRLEFVREYRNGFSSMAELCDAYGISRKTGYQWVARYERDGAAGLLERSRRPHTSPRATAPEIVERLLEARRQHPTWSARKLIRVLAEREPTVAWPTRSTGCELLRRHGLVRVRRRGRRLHAPVAPLPAITRPNEVWTTDFKGEFRTGDGQYCYPLTVRDGFSRYVLRCDALDTRRSEPVRRRFERAFAAYGLPDRIRSDNGGPFAAPGLTRLSRLAVWWIRLGILPERIAPGHPEQNGSHEQFHRVLKAETTRPPAVNQQAQQRRFAAFCVEYNDVRPHEALADRPPAAVYQPSRREWPRDLPAVEYPGHMEVRRVSPCGTVSWRNDALYLTEVLSGERVGFEEVNDGIWMITFATVAIARFDERTRRVIAMPYARQ
jgi:transposase InsO family protein